MPPLVPFGDCRPATQADASSLAAISIEVWLNTYIRKGVNAHFADYALAQFTAESFRTALAKPTEHYLVSQNEDGIDGYICISTQSPSPIDPSSQVEIGTLYVQPRHQGAGIGKALVEAALTLCHERKFERIWLAVNAENPRAVAFYQREGFQQVGTTHFQIGEQKYPNFVLERRAV